MGAGHGMPSVEHPALRATPHELEAMELALAEARAAGAEGEAPVGAVVLRSGRVVAARHNERDRRRDPTAHAEVLALRDAAVALGDWRLEDATVVVTLEPCVMCAGALAQARVARVVFGAYDPKGGGVEHGARVFEASSCHHRPEIIGGLRERACADLLRAFFAARRPL